jgi:hypothetical protein
MWPLYQVTGQGRAAADTVTANCSTVVSNQSSSDRVGGSS